MKQDTLACKVVGLKKAHFENNNGDDVKYARLYVVYNESKVNGQVAAELKVEYAIANAFKKLIGKKVEVGFNRYGKVADYEEITGDDDADEYDSDLPFDRDCDADDDLDDLA